MFSEKIFLRLTLLVGLSQPLHSPFGEHTMKTYASPIFAALVSACMIFSPVGHASDIFVDPSGNDANPGTKAKPLSSLVGARDAVRKINKDMKEDINIHFRAGVYRVPQTVEFGPQDSGQNGHKVIFGSFENDKPILTGGVAVTNWSVHNKELNIYKAPAPKSVFRQVYIDDKRGIRARTPNKKSDSDFGPYIRPTIKKLGEIMLSESEWKACADVKQLDQVEIVLTSHYYHQRLHIGAQSISNGIVTVLPKYPEGKFNKALYFYQSHSVLYIENALEFIDADNEWYHDPNEGMLYLALAKGQHPNQHQIEVPLTSILVDVRGSADHPVQDLEFRGLTFQCSNWTFPSEKGINMTQLAQPQPLEAKREMNNPAYPQGIIRAAHAKQIAFRNNVIRNTGAQGLQFFENVDDSDIEGNEIYDIAANGIEIDTHKEKNPPPEKQSTGVAIWNNTISKVGRDYTSGGAVLAHFVKGLIVDHNLIFDLPYTGIQVGNQPAAKVPEQLGCGENQVRYNHVHHTNQLQDDGGAIYTLGGLQNGTVIAENFIQVYPKSAWTGTWSRKAVYLDNGTGNVVVKNNAATGGELKAMNGSTGCIFENNKETNPEVEKNAGIKLGYNPRKSQ